MSLFGSLYAGVSGLNAQSRSLAMISDNVSNVSTTGYKGASAQFASLVTRAAGAAGYSPGGVRTFTHYAITQQGLIQSTASATDVAIAGNGFFVVNTLPDGSGSQFYTRAGAFEPDAEGRLVNPAGVYLQGWRLDANGAPVNVNQLETVDIDVATGTASPTTALALGGNLDADQAAFTGVYAAGDMADWAASGGATGVQPHFTRDVEIFDSLGRVHNVTMAFLKDPAANSWSVEVYGSTAELDASHVDGLVASGTVTFDGEGKLLTNSVPSPITINWLATSGADPSTVTLDLGTVGGRDGLAQLAAETDLAPTQDGAPVGQLSAVSVDAAGYVVASFTNGEQVRIYQVPLATFPNAGGLDPRSGTLYAASDTSGTMLLRAAGTGGAGEISGSALEAGTVDIAEEFTKMIVTQRAYSANAKVITTADQMLEELVRIR